MTPTPKGDKNATENTKDTWINADKDIRDYPLGTKYKAIGGGYWTRVINGFKWCTGSTFSSVGGDWTHEVSLPKPAHTETPAIDESGLSKDDAAHEFTISREQYHRDEAESANVYDAFFAGCVWQEHRTATPDAGQTMTLWAVVTPEGVIMHDTIETKDDWSIYRFIEGSSQFTTWIQGKDVGYTCQEFEVTFKPKK